MTIRLYAGGLATTLVALGLSACAANTPPAETPPPAAEPVAEPAPAPAPTPENTEAELPPATEVEELEYVEGVAGGVMTSKIQLEAVVISVDQKKRQAVLRGPEGNEVLVRVGKDAVNFYQVAAGDRVNVIAERELAIYVPDADKEKDEAPDGMVAASVSAPKGDTPAGAVVTTTKVTSKLTAMDTKARTATLTFEDGKKETFQVRPDVDMTKYKVGQKVVFLLTELLALGVQKL